MTGRSVINFGRIVAKRVKNNLFGGKNVNTGNMISEDGGNKCATTRARPASTPSHDPILNPPSSLRPLSVRRRRLARVPSRRSPRLADHAPSLPPSFPLNPRTRRRWKPNAQRKRLYSEALDELVRVNVTTYALRWIDKAGGLDAYLLNTTPQKLMSYKALELRKRVLDAKGIKESEWKRPPGGLGGIRPPRSQREADAAAAAAADANA
ncbi:uncharacterized protein MICPUCDRAFT_60375 [Micromonas pusilla CCMP1545]|jgi:large subunit ribosomal protein L28|uniref:Large ribosomal subunit protein bL28m n=1 Tax=Micromonas pusilla (strain CCMP1545) TaxID=564608 RepID=C1MY26_MICPC|nr:uncharacterized protein MICPUCDRAFT_60375 [Micromonas pusilla CCMP1545]EEH55569.1 predicted protein [Micromonas pusilla CCMP1545]|tara:strand:- start:1044 stop:1670 length:627 start_codon:yes stop_codon:yes gene_type:complete|eukprot:XP_003060800.1 predicted protein [Micromonas pusilla CCMP1545]